MKSDSQLRIMVICTGNSCRSQMAEAWFKHLAKDRMLVVSAGSHPTGYVHPLAIEVMDEEGIDMSKYESKSLTHFLDNEFDLVITVCDDAAETCPVFPGQGERIHWSFEDPAKVAGSELEVREAFRNTRDLIQNRVAEFIEKNK